MMIKYYFGTDLRSAGHYMHEFNADGDWMKDHGTNFRMLPFNPEYVTEGLADGQVNFQHHMSPLGNFTVCAIAGSPTDKRPGCKSVFIYDGIITFDEMKELVEKGRATKKILEGLQKRFEIQWPKI